MQQDPWSNLATMTLLAAALHGTLSAVEPVALKYSADQSVSPNVYSVSIESRGESGREMIGGNLLVTATNREGNLIGISARGQMMHKPIPGQMPFMGYRPGGPPPLNSLVMGPIPEAREIWINPQGQIVRTSGDLNLPVPLGQLVASLVEVLPPKETTGWENEQDVFVLDDPQGLGPVLPSASSGYGPTFYYPGRTAPGVLAVRQKTKTRVVASDAETITLEREVTLDSYVLTGKEPRISATLQAKVVRLRASGFPQSLELQGKSLFNSENVTRRAELTLKWQLLTGSEREKVLNPPPPAPVNPFTAEEIAARLDDLNSTESYKRSNAARELNSARLANPSDSLLNQMAKLAFDADETVRESAISILAAHGSREQVPALIRALKSPGASNSRTKIVQALARLKDPRAVQPLAGLLAEGSTEQFGYVNARENALTQALISLGSEAEEQVLEVLKLPNLTTRLQACAILKEIGTRKSLQPLRELTTHPVKELSEAAAEAARLVSSRQNR